MSPANPARFILQPALFHALRMVILVCILAASASAALREDLPEPSAREMSPRLESCCRTASAPTRNAGMNGASFSFACKRGEPSAEELSNALGISQKSSQAEAADLLVKVGPMHALLGTNSMAEVLISTSAISDRIMFIGGLNTLFAVCARSTTDNQDQHRRE